MTIGIVGLGLIGGSIGLALRAADRRIVGCDLDPAHTATALARGCVDEVVPLVEVSQADVVFLAVPPEATPAVLRAVLEAKGPETVVTDCASVKGDIIRWIRANAPAETRFVGGHPMAGHEKGGPAYASGWLFRGARWILTPHAKTSKSAVRRVEEAVKAAGAIPVRIDADEHDRQVAVLSHLPHVLAGALVQAAEPLEHVDAGAGSWRDLTRVGGVDPDLWTQIMLGNRERLIEALADFEGQLSGVRQALLAGDAEAVRAFLVRAKLAKSKHEPVANRPSRSVRRGPPRPQR